MKAGTETFGTLVGEAHVGKLQLPAFQRQWKWQRRQVISLYDSLRKNFPIGTLLLLQAREDLNLSPRLFEGASAGHEASLQRYVLDGQQRLTAGIGLFHQVDAATRYFLDLSKLWEMSNEYKLNFQDEVQIAKFAEDLDDDDGYCVPKRTAASADQLLVNSHLLWTAWLTDEPKLQRAADNYLEAYPERKDYFNFLIRPYFKPASANLPTITLDEHESVEAVTKIFATLNTSGTPLTPFEIVVATLFPTGIDLRKDVQENQEATTYYQHMDPSGELYLQTIALLAGQSPKKTRLPKTMTAERYRTWCDKAVQMLEDLGEFLSKRLGLGLDVGSSLVPYDAIFPPMAVLLARSKDWGLTGPQRGACDLRFERWFIASALSQRYSEGVHSKQESDVRDMPRWLQDGDDHLPTWLNDFQMPRLINASPNGAIGRLIACLLNRERPRDPLTGELVGYYADAKSNTERHHVFPSKFCENHLPDWGATDESNVALNMMFTDNPTNRRWSKMDPANQIQDIEESITDPNVRASSLERHGLSAEMIHLMKKQGKTKADFVRFLEEREKFFANKFAEWSLAGPSVPLTEDD